MKRIQIGFAAIIAVLAMSFTIAEHSGAFKGKTAKLGTDCFKAGGTTALQIKSTCTDNAVTINATDDCLTANSQKVWSLDPSNVILRGSILTSCVGSGRFCCFTVVEDTNPCADPNPVQPTFNIGDGAKAYKIDEVFCKSPL